MRSLFWLVTKPIFLLHTLDFGKVAQLLHVQSFAKTTNWIIGQLSESALSKTYLCLLQSARSLYLFLHILLLTCVMFYHSCLQLYVFRRFFCLPLVSYFLSSPFIFALNSESVVYVTRHRFSNQLTSKTRNSFATYNY